LAGLGDLTWAAGRPRPRRDERRRPRRLRAARTPSLSTGDGQPDEPRPHSRPSKGKRAGLPRRPFRRRRRPLTNLSWKEVIKTDRCGRSSKLSFDSPNGAWPRYKLRTGHGSSRRATGTAQAAARTGNDRRCPNPESAAARTGTTAGAPTLNPPPPADNAAPNQRATASGSDEATRRQGACAHVQGRCGYL